MFDRLTNTLLRGEGVATGSLLLVSGLVIALALRALVAVGHRQRLRAPTLLVLFGAGLMIALDFIVPSPTRLQRWLSVVPVALLLLAFGRLISVAVFDWILARRLQTESPRIVRDIVDGFFTAVALLVTLGAMGVEPGSLLTTSAVITAVVGLSLQDTLGNLFAGLSLQWQRPFTAGDWIQVDKEGLQVGRVVEINWRATRLLTGDSQELIIPNSQLARSVILNHSRPSQDSARAVKVTLPYEVPTQRAHAILVRATEGVPGIDAEPEPKAVTVAFLDQGIQYEVRFQIRDFAERGAVETTIRDRIWYVLHRAGLPFAHSPNKLSSLASEAADAQRDERARALRRIDFLRDLSDASIATLASASRTEPYAPGEYVIRQGDVSEELYLCLSGELVVLHQADHGQQREVARLHAGGLFGEFAQLTGQARAATVQAATSCELVVVDKAAFTLLLRENPALAELISERLAERRAELDKLERATPDLKRATVAQHKGQFLQRLREFFLD
jgi:small-conductance mechanosensitive channel/CRP-like cAMP-binding protein